MLGRESLFLSFCQGCVLTDDRSFSSALSCHPVRFIYELIHCGNLDWVYGGEYGQLSMLITVVVKGWLAVGLRPHFVFDGTHALDLRFLTRTDGCFAFDRSLPSAKVRDRHITDER